MPELPEVETIRRGIESLVLNQIIRQIIIRKPRLRWPVPLSLKQTLPGLVFQQVYRRGKYLLLSTTQGTLIIHLGMSGNLRIVPVTTKALKHDHIDIRFENGNCLRYHDPRRFGAMLWTSKDPYQHKLLKNLGVEPLGKSFNGAYLFTCSRNRKVAVKQYIMNSRIVAGVGNIYANESLFMSGINPSQAAGRINLESYRSLVSSIKQVLQSSIRCGGTTLRDFTNTRGQPGHFSQNLNVYGREGLACPNCGTKIRMQRQGGRATYFCRNCQQ